MKLVDTVRATTGAWGRRCGLSVEAAVRVGKPAMPTLFLKVGIFLVAFLLELLMVPSVKAQSCFICARNGGCYPASSGYYYCWRTGNGCSVSVPCAVAGGGDCPGDPECLPRPVPLSLDKKAQKTKSAAKGSRAEQAAPVTYSEEGSRRHDF